MTLNPHTISVIIPAYNAAQYLGAAIDSVLTQTRPPDEIIVVNDGSTDETLSVLERLSTAEAVSAREQPPLAGARVYERRGIPIRVICQENAGPAVARNTGVHAAQGNWIAFLDSDDVWFPDKLERQVAVLQPGTLLCAEVAVFTGNDKPTLPTTHSTAIAEFGFARLLQRNRIVTSTVIAPRAALLEIGGFDSRYRGPEDFDCWLRLAARGVSVRKMTAQVAGYRISPQSLSQQVEKMRDQELRIVTEQARGCGPKLSGRLRRQALAGVHYRAGIGFAEAQHLRAAIRSLFRSFIITPRKLPEYSQAKSWPRLRLLARCLWSSVHSL